MSTNKIISGCAFHHVAIETTNYEGTKSFYQDVLGCALAHEWGSDERRLCLLDLGDGGHIEVIGATALPDGPAKQYPMIHFAMRVDDVDAAADRVRAAGCTITLEPKDVSLDGRPVRVAFFLGPNGEVLELFDGRGQT